MDFADDTLTPEQESAVAALIAQPTVAKAAEAAGVAERTLYRWLREEPFRAAYRAARRETFGQAIGLCQQYTPHAIQSLARVMTDPASAGASKVAAASALLRFARESIELDDLAERIEKLEAQSNPTPSPDRNEAGRW